MPAFPRSAASRHFRPLLSSTQVIFNCLLAGEPAKSVPGTRLIQTMEGNVQPQLAENDILHVTDGCAAPAAAAAERGADGGTAGVLTRVLADISASRLERLRDRVGPLIDRAIARQLDDILHHPRLQRLEGSWRGLEYLVATKAECSETPAIKVKVLNVSWLELGRDLSRALEFEQSQAFQRIYSDEFDMPGGEPFGVVLGDYLISHRSQPGHGNSDVEIVREMARIGSAALCPFISSADASLFGLDSFADMPHPVSLETAFMQREYTQWRSLRADEVTRFVGVVLPRVLARLPYRDDGTRSEPVLYRENVAGSPENYLWMSGCYAFGGVLVRAFAHTGWFADIRGGIHEFGEGGVVGSLLHSAFDFDRQRLAPRCATDIQIDDFDEREFSDFGFIPLCSHHSVEHSVFYSNSSLHQPPDLGADEANANAKLATMLQYTLCVARFGHYIKVIGRDKIGSFIRAEECQRLLQNWLNQYTTANEGSSAELRARYPLAASRVEVSELPARPGHFRCVIWLRPHFQLDELVSNIHLVTELAVGTVSTEPTPSF